MAENNANDRPSDYPPQLVREAMDLAVNDILRNVSATQTVGQLCRMGLDSQTAATLYGQVRTATKAARRRSAVVLMVAGTFWLLACVLAYVLSELGRMSALPRQGLGLLAAIALIQMIAGFFRWRKATQL